jgi:hypothetical protein
VVSGKGKDLLQLEGDGFLMRLRPEGRAGSVRTYRLTPELVENRSTELAVKIEEVVAPKDVEIALDWRAEREVPVKPAIELQIADRYIQVGEMSVEPRVVGLSGPAGQLGRVSYVSTDSLVLSQVQEDVDLQLALRPPAGMRCALNPPQVQVRADVQPLAQDDLDQVPVKVRHSMGRTVELEPSQVRVRVKGGFDILANLDPERDLEFFVDFRDFTGEPLSVLYEDSPRFEVIEIVPSKVALVER